ncbi:MAG: hypothetical protein JO210_12520 [Acidobacteriaceae bacterium]|nr:hypothetical protein [Acidobacteriaceae bacterium]
MNSHSKLLTFSTSALVLILGAAGSLRAQEPDQVTVADLADAKRMFHAPPGTIKTQSPRSALLRSFVQGIDSLQVFGGSYSVFGYDPTNGFRTNWSYNMVGNPPAQGGTTTFRAPIVPVSILMLNADGTPRYVKGQLLYSDATKYVSKVVDSPIFENHKYSSSRTPTQYIDAIQRAEFWSQVGRDDEDSSASDLKGWHTLLKPQIKTSRLMLLPHGSYRFGLNADGSCCAFVLVDSNTFGQLLFPATYPFDGSTAVGAAELAGDITTKDISTFLFPNTFLYDNGDPKNCCTLGYHTYDFEPGTNSNGNLLRFYVLNYSSWISPGLFGDSVEDVTALSHELAETANDPFVDNITPWWLAPFGLCQDNLEVGDVIEGLSDAVYPIKINGVTYHPQNVALLPWFEFKAVSSAIDHAYSYPGTDVLTALSPVEMASCKK